MPDTARQCGPRSSVTEHEFRLTRTILLVSEFRLRNMVIGSMNGPLHASFRSTSCGQHDVTVWQQVAR